MFHFRENSIFEKALKLFSGKFKKVVQKWGFLVQFRAVVTKKWMMTALRNRSQFYVW